MIQNRFLENAWRGNPEPLNQVLAIGITWLVFLIFGGSFLLIPVGILMVTDPDAATDYLADPTNFKLLKIDMILVFVLLMAQFVLGMAALWLTERTLLKKKFLWIATGFKRFRWGRMLAAMGMWVSFMAIYQVITYLLDPSTMTFTLDLGRFLLFLPIALILVPIQSAFEELAVRGQLMQGLIRLAPDKPYLPLFLSSLIFAMLHLLNKEVQEYGLPLMMAHYFTFGLVLGIFAIIDEGLEISIGLHAGNNIFSLCLVSYPGSSIQTPALFSQSTMTAELDYVVMLVFVAIGLLLFFGRRKQPWRALLDNVSTGPAEKES